MIWIAPPTLKPLVCDICKDSITTPWPEKEASPWSRTGTTFFLSLSSSLSCLALTEPRTTGSTISKWDGLLLRDTWTSPPGVLIFDENPKWYLTSPVFAPSSSPLSSNAENKSAGNLPRTFTNKFNLPLWAIPKHIWLAPRLPQFCITASTKGTNDSLPSIPNRFIPGYLAAKYFAKPSAEFSLSYICNFSSFEKE